MPGCISGRSIDMWAGNEIYLYEVLATNILQAMLVRRAERWWNAARWPRAEFSQPRRPR